jgi:hypothetical protein
MATGRARRGTSLCAAAVPMAAGSLWLLAGAPASAATPGGIATIALPGTAAASPLRAGGSATEFTVALPANAACSGDTAHDGYLVYSYLVRQGTDLSGVTFINYPSEGYGIVDTTDTYYGPVNTAMGTGQIIGIPNDFAWGPLVTSDGGAVPLSRLLYDGTTGTWETGVACANTHGKLADDWNAQVTFTADPKDPNGFTWSTVPGSGTSSASSTGGTASTVANSATGTGTGAASTTGTAGTSRSGRSAGDDGSPATGGHLGSSSNRTAARATGTAAASEGGAADLPLIAAVVAGVLAAGVGLLLVRRGGRRRQAAAPSSGEQEQ